MASLIGHVTIFSNIIVNKTTHKTRVLNVTIYRKLYDSPQRFRLQKKAHGCVHRTSLILFYNNPSLSLVLIWR